MLTAFQAVRAEYKQAYSSVDMGELYHYACRFERELIVAMQREEWLRAEVVHLRRLLDARGSPTAAPVNHENRNE